MEIRVRSTEVIAWRDVLFQKQYTPFLQVIWTGNTLNPLAIFLVTRCLLCRRSDAAAISNITLAVIDQ